MREIGSRGIYDRLRPVKAEISVSLADVLWVPGVWSSLSRPCFIEFGPSLPQKLLKCYVFPSFTWPPGSWGVTQPEFWSSILLLSFFLGFCFFGFQFSFLFIMIFSFVLPRVFMFCRLEMILFMNGCVLFALHLWLHLPLHQVISFFPPTFMWYSCHFLHIEDNMWFRCGGWNHFFYWNLWLIQKKNEECDLMFLLHVLLSYHVGRIREIHTC